MTNKLSRKREYSTAQGLAGVSLGGCGPLENPTARHRLLGIDSQHGLSLVWVTPSPLICSRAIFTTSASKSARERFSQIRSRRRARSFRTQSSLPSGRSESRPGDFAADAARARTNPSVMGILPHLGCERSTGAPRHKGCRRCRYTVSNGTTDNVVVDSKDAATRLSRI